MSYVFDNSPLSSLFKNFYPKTFPTLWKNFDDLVVQGSIVSTREALREIEDGAPPPSSACWSAPATSGPPGAKAE